MNLLFALILIVGVEECLSYKACKRIKPAENFNSEWYFGVLKTSETGGMHVIATSECQNCEKQDKPWHWLRQRTNPTKYCYRVHGITPEGYFNIDAYCEFPNPERPHSNCALDFSKYETKISCKVKGSATVILTDNENYLVSNFCLFGKENLWYLTSDKQDLDPELKEEIFSKIAELGLDTTLAVEGVSPVIFKNSTIIECK